MTAFTHLRLQAKVALLLIAVTTVFVSETQALDRVRDRNGVTTGKITKMSALGVTITKGGVDTKKPVEEILSITFNDEPESLTPARRAADSGRFKNALDKLAKIGDDETERAEIKQEVDFLVTYCKVQLALSGQGTLEQAKKQVASFLSQHSKSFHVPKAIELLGDVLLADQDFDGARAQYAKLGKAPAPYFKARSALLLGRSLQTEGKQQAAVDAFNNALKAAKGNAVAQSQVMQATLHHAVSQSALGETDKSTETVKQIISQADTEDASLLAQAYNALGDCYLKSNQKRAACQSFLHVDLLFSKVANEHARALYELSQLWDELGKPTRARDAQQRLKDKYPVSRWANR